jgi:hypothetical protein
MVKIWILNIIMTIVNKYEIQDLNQIFFLKTLTILSMSDQSDKKILK